MMQVQVQKIVKLILNFSDKVSNLFFIATFNIIYVLSRLHLASSTFSNGIFCDLCTHLCIIVIL